MRKLSRCSAFAFVLASALVGHAPAHAASAADVSAQLVTPLKPGLYQSELNPGSSVTFTVNQNEYLSVAPERPQGVRIAFAKLKCTPYMLMMFLGGQGDAEVVVSVFVAVADDGTHFSVPSLTVKGVNKPADVILDLVAPAASNSPFTAVAAKGCDYFNLYQFGEDADFMTLQSP